MHELSIAYNIVEIVTEKAKENRASVINEIELNIGEVSGVVQEALETALHSAIKDTIMANANIIIHKIKPEAECMDCGAIFSPDDIISNCPECKSFKVFFKKGKEISVKSINIET